ncbi:hypothetical protein ADK64_32725 [Streptomyces sp. MMG1121]|nr:hypothetical protein ADK64_32725 [Streptomyces sp. MMG1121]
MLRSARRAPPAVELLRSLGDDVAHSRVTTALPRMPGDGVPPRTEQGRSYANAPATDARGVTARRMHQTPESDPDREAVLARSVDEPPATDEGPMRRQLPGTAPEER